MIGNRSRTSLIVLGFGLTYAPVGVARLLVSGDVPYVGEEGEQAALEDAGLQLSED